MLIFLILEGLFYPPCVLLSAAIIFVKFIHYKNDKISLVSNSRERKCYLLGLVVSAILLLTYLVNSSEFGPIIGKAEALRLPEFYSEGRASFFNNNSIQYWLLGIRSGMLPRGILTPVTLSLGLLFLYLEDAHLFYFGYNNFCFGLSVPCLPAGR